MEIRLLKEYILYMGLILQQNLASIQVLHTVFSSPL